MLENIVDKFQSNVCIVEIEGNSFCNRRCSYCINYYIDKTQKNDVMPRKLFQKIIDELANVSYKRMITFHRYNEPFYNRNEEILFRIQYARKKLPNARLIASSNADYLDSEYLRRIQEAGLDELYLQCHTEHMSHYTDQDIQNRISQINEQIGSFKGKFIHKEYATIFLTAYSGFKILTIQTKDFIRDGFTRGGIAKNVQSRPIEGPCYQPLTSMTIDYNGNVTICCNSVSYHENHKEYIMGNCNEKTLYEIYSSEKAVYYRENLMKGIREEICYQCNCNNRELALKYHVIDF